jgi:methylthioribulose 1-phosphate dehydratase/enolase-phosphatase E1
VYVWGKDWIQAKTQAECYDYLFEAAVKMAQLGINAAQPPAPLVANGSAVEGKRHAENGVSAGGCLGGLTAAERVFAKCNSSVCVLPK